MLLEYRPPRLLLRRRRRRCRTSSRRRSISRHRCNIRLIDAVRITGAIYGSGVVIVHIKETAGAAEFLMVAGTQHVAGAEGGGGGGGGERSPTEALFCVFETGVCLVVGFAESDAGFDGHAGCIGVGSAAQESPGC